MSKRFVITIDGPTGTGKSTAARLLARRLGYLYLDTGAMYRAVALTAIRRGLRLTDRRGLSRLARGCRIRFQPGPAGRLKVFVNGADVTRAIRRPEIGEAASVVATLPGVRQALVRQQRAIGRQGRVVAEGRDAGTVVFPRAPAKFFLTASLRERARRRTEELKGAGRRAAFSSVLREVRERDRRDRSRSASPLRPAAGAVRMDSTRLKSSEVLAKLIDYVRRIQNGACVGGKPL